MEKKICLCTSDFFLLRQRNSSFFNVSQSDFYVVDRGYKSLQFCVCVCMCVCNRKPWLDTFCNVLRVTNSRQLKLVNKHSVNKPWIFVKKGIFVSIFTTKPGVRVFWQPLCRRDLYFYLLLRHDYVINSVFLFDCFVPYQPELTNMTFSLPKVDYNTTSVDP